MNELTQLDKDIAVETQKLHEIQFAEREAKERLKVLDRQAEKSVLIQEQLAKLQENLYDEIHTAHKEKVQLKKKLYRMRKKKRKLERNDSNPERTDTKGFE